MEKQAMKIEEMIDNNHRLEPELAIRLHRQLLGHNGCGVTELRVFEPKPLVAYTDNEDDTVRLAMEFDNKARQARLIVQEGRYIPCPPHPSCKHHQQCTAPMCPLHPLLSERDCADAEYICSVQNKKLDIKANTLTKFVRNHCSNFLMWDTSCVIGNSCKVMLGGKCDWFEKAVFPVCDQWKSISKITMKKCNDNKQGETPYLSPKQVALRWQCSRSSVDRIACTSSKALRQIGIFV